MMMRHLISMVFVVLGFAVMASAQSDIRQVDFRNFTYSAYCAADTASKVTVKDAEFYEEKQADGYVDRFSFTVMDISYGDLTGDNRDEAIILSVCNTGGTGNFSEGFVYAMKSGKPSLVARIPGGDRAHGGLRKVLPAHGLLIVESNAAGREGGSCCPQYIVTTTYRLDGGRLAKVGTPARRELFPSLRVTFPKGSSGTTFSTTIRAEEGKRFLVAARAGQTLTASVDTDKVSLRLLEEAEVTPGINNFLAKLPKNGDYTIELQNETDKPVALTVNIKIQ